MTWRFRFAVFRASLWSFWTLIFLTMSVVEWTGLDPEGDYEAAAGAPSSRCSPGSSRRRACTPSARGAGSCA
jgi:hypothetical protein